MAFCEETLMWKSYTTHKALPITKQVQLVDWKEFVIATLDVDNEIFVMYVAIRESEEIIIDLARKAQIEDQSGAQVGVLIFDKAPTEVLAEYSNHSNVYLAENAIELLENTGINEHAIELK